MPTCRKPRYLHPHGQKRVDPSDVLSNRRANSKSQEYQCFTKRQHLLLDKLSNSRETNCPKWRDRNKVERMSYVTTGDAGRSLDASAASSSINACPAILARAVLFPWPVHEFECCKRSQDIPTVIVDIVICGEVEFSPNSIKIVGSSFVYDLVGQFPYGAELRKVVM